MPHPKKSCVLEAIKQWRKYSMINSSDCDVLVVGCGPVGAMLAGLLRTRGLSVIAIDREIDIYPLPRAGAFDDEAMRSFQMLGVSDKLVPMTRALEGMQFRSVDGDVLLEMLIPPGRGPYGWAQTYVLHQPTIERVLRDHLAEIGVDLRVATKLLDFEQKHDGVTAQVENAHGAGTITAKYIVGCDGAKSRVREVGSAGSFDYGFSESWLVVDAIVKDGRDLPELLTQILDPAQPTTYVHMLGDRYRWEFMLKPGDDAAAFASDATLERLLAPWNDNARIEVERRAIYRFQGLVANKWRDQRAFLAGDAAHLMPPFAGQGMCSGFRDAANLAWKIGAVISGEAGECLLNSYQYEREAHVRALIEHSIGLGKMICELDPEKAARRDAGMRAMRAAGQPQPSLPAPPLKGGCLTESSGAGEMFLQPVIGSLRFDDVAGPGPWLITRSDTGADGLKRLSLTEEQLQPFAGQLEQWLDARGAEAVLVRPDRYIFGVGDADLLEATWREKLAVAI